MRRPGLLEFAASQPTVARRCWVCSIPEAAEINQARLASEELIAKTNGARGGVSVPATLRWLQDVRGYSDATLPRLNNHFTRGHHRNGKVQPSTR